MNYEADVLPSREDTRQRGHLLYFQLKGDCWEDSYLHTHSVHTEIFRHKLSWWPIANSPPLQYWYSQPPLLAQMCNGSIAGLGYLEVCVDCPCKPPFGQLVSVRNVHLQWGKNCTIPNWRPQAQTSSHFRSKNNGCLMHNVPLSVYVI